MVVPKKNGKLRICVDFRRFNAATKKDPYPLPFTDEVLDTIIGYAAYSFIDYFSGYHQVHIHENDRYKTAFITEWGAYVWVVMPFGLKNAPPTYQRIVNQIFKDYLNDFMKLFLDNFSVYSDIATHLPKLRLVFEQCREYGVGLNPDKCIFYVPSGVILGYIVCQAGKFPDPKKLRPWSICPHQKMSRPFKLSTNWHNSTDALLKTMRASWNLLPGSQGKEKLLTGLSSVKMLTNTSRTGTRMPQSSSESTGNWSFMFIPMHPTLRLVPCWHKTLLEKWIR